LRPDLTASKTNAIPESALTSTCTPTAHTVSGVKKLPLNLLDAIRALEDSALMAESLGHLCRLTSSSRSMNGTSTRAISPIGSAKPRSTARAARLVGRSLNSEPGGSKPAALERRFEFLAI
jgi:hypothetical protein